MESDLALIAQLLADLERRGVARADLQQLAAIIGGTTPPPQWTPADRFGILFCLWLLQAIVVAQPARGSAWFARWIGAVPRQRRTLMRALWVTATYWAPATVTAVLPWWCAVFRHDESDAEKGR